MSKSKLADNSWERYYGGKYPNLVTRYDLTVKLVKPPSVLDIGCAQCLLGYLLLKSRSDVTRIVGLDNHRPTLDFAIHRLKGLPVELRYGQAEDLPFGDASFATVVICETIEHVAVVAPVVKEALRVLQPGGRLITSVPADEVRPSKKHKRVFRSLEEFQVIFGAQVGWLGAKRLHRWYFAWGDKR